MTFPRFFPEWVYSSRSNAIGQGEEAAFCLRHSLLEGRMSVEPFFPCNDRRKDGILSTKSQREQKASLFSPETHSTKFAFQSLVQLFGRSCCRNCHCPRPLPKPREANRGILFSFFLSTENACWSTSPESPSWQIPEVYDLSRFLVNGINSGLVSNGRGYF